MDDVGNRFDHAWMDADIATATPELLPMRLARACAAVLPVAAAGMSLFDHQYRVPLGASDDTATFAERLQFTHGAGPCLEAGARNVAVVVDVDEMARRWPAFTADLEQHTPYRAVVSLPLHVGVNVLGAINLYLDSPAAVTELPLADVVTVAARITAALVTAQVDPTDLDDDLDVATPAWVTTPSSRDRSRVWIALGMLMTAQGLRADDALALLRSYAYGHDTVLDDLALDLVEGRVTTEQIVV